MKSKLYVLFVVVIVALLLVTPVLAITFGQPDGDGHPNVGAMLVVEPDGVEYFYCSGTLIAPDVYLTAAHCTAAADYYGADPHDVWVTFDQVIDEKAKRYRGTYYLNPNYGHDSHDLHDVAVILLDKPIKNITPATLPTAGYLDYLKDANKLKDQPFVTVGYGRVRNNKTGAWHAFEGYGERLYAYQSYNSLTSSWLKLSMNPATGDGGTCYGDSGGPHFLGDSDVIVSLTVTGDAWCRATDVTYRLDTESARSYLQQFVDLP